MQAMEDGKRDKTQLTTDTPMTSSTVAASQYRRDKNRNVINKPMENHHQCPGCGSTEHGRGTKFPRYLHCPAWQATCEVCNMRGHFKRVCRNKQPPRQQQGKSSTFQSYQTQSETNTATPEPSYFYSHEQVEFAHQVKLKNREAWQQ